MGKKVSASLFRVNKFNIYRNKWVFNYKLKLNFFLNNYYKINIFYNNLWLNINNFYFNNIYYLSGKIINNKTNNKFINRFIFLYKKKDFTNLNFFVKLYNINISYLSLQKLKLLIKFNLLKYISIQNLYNKLYTIILTEYLNHNSNFLGLKIIISGRLNNTKLATSEIFQIGFLPLQQLDVFICYEKFSILTKYGLLGIKIWLGKK